VYPTRTARFGTALTRKGTVNLHQAMHASDVAAVEDGCDCACCAGYSRAAVHIMLKDTVRNTLGGALLSVHNIAYMLRLSAEMRAAVVDRRYAAFCNEFLRDWAPGPAPAWVVDALGSVGIRVALALYS